MNTQTDEPRFLNQYGLMAERHWREFLPQMVARLEAEGRLMAALVEAQETTLDEMETLTRRMEKDQAMTPEQAQAAAWELVREKYILLPPERSNG
jgi:hypothetical protein